EQLEEWNGECAHEASIEAEDRIADVRYTVRDRARAAFEASFANRGKLRLELRTVHAHAAEVFCQVHHPVSLLIVGEGEDHTPRTTANQIDRGADAHDEAAHAGIFLAVHDETLAAIRHDQVAGLADLTRE